jgi:UDP-glucose 4-epimerase
MKYFLVGGAGFIGSHFTDQLLKQPEVGGVTLYDNFSSGREWHYAQHQGNKKLTVVRGDVNDTKLLTRSMDGHDVVIHFASNPDIAKAVTDPDIDFREGTVLTRNVVEAMRQTSAKRILYTSGSGVYGDLGELEATEDYGPKTPISTYGASKLAGENLISSYSFMFDISGCVFRFGNVVGPRQTHGVGYDFLRRLYQDPSELRILGDGRQSKSYVHVYDVVRAVLLANDKQTVPFQVYNVASGDYITVSEIADCAVQVLGIDRGKVEYVYSGGDRGWKGDVPVIRLNIDRIKSLGWTPEYSSRGAICASLEGMLPDLKQNRFS